MLTEIRDYLACVTRYIECAELFSRLCARAAGESSAGGWFLAFYFANVGGALA
jgi:hypothetical protein